MNPSTCLHADPSWKVSYRLFALSLITALLLFFQALSPLVSYAEGPGENDKRPAKRLEPVKVNTLQTFPIIFLPGVAGTRLYRPHMGLTGGDEELWPFSGSTRNLQMLFMDEKGDPIIKDVSPGDILRYAGEYAPTFLGNFSVYHDFLNSIQSIEFREGEGVWSYKEGENLFVWGYDWRLDNADHLFTLDKFVNHVRAKTKSKKVILIAHSMGGLIARAYAVKNLDKVETIISIGSPFAGSPKPFYALLMGYSFGNDYVDPQDMKELFQNAPSTYQLLPQYDFIKEIPNQDFYSKIKYKGARPLYTSFYVASNSRSMNKSLLQKAESFYISVGTSFNPVQLPSKVKHYAIIGVGVQTLEGFVLRQAVPTDQSYLDYNGQNVVLNPQFGNGDGTVPLKSANIKDTTMTYFIQHGEGDESSGSHGGLPNNRIVQEIVRSILTGDPKTITDRPDPVKPLVNIEPETDFTLR